MRLRIVFTRNDHSFISRAIMWFTQRKRAKERRCSHVFFKFRPAGIFTGWWAYEAMERGCWMSPYEKALGKQTVVAEFCIKAPDSIVDKAIVGLIDETAGDWYDFEGIWRWAWWIFANRFFGTIVKVLKLTFRPGRAHEGAFCSGLVLMGLRKIQSDLVHEDFGITNLTPRTSSPQGEIDICFGHPDVYQGGLGPLDKERETQPG